MSMEKRIPPTKKSLATSLIIVLTLILLFSLVESTVAQGNNMIVMRHTSDAVSPLMGPTDHAEVEAFMDELFAKELDENHIPGAAVSVVKDGQLFFAKGYGYADLENKTPDLTRRRFTLLLEQVLHYRLKGFFYSTSLNRLNLCWS